MRVPAGAWRRTLRLEQVQRQSEAAHFRQGPAGAWRRTLRLEQVQRQSEVAFFRHGRGGRTLRLEHGAVMQRFG